MPSVGLNVWPDQVGTSLGRLTLWHASFLDISPILMLLSADEHPAP